MTKNNVFLTLVISVAAGLITSAFGFWSITEKESALTSATGNRPVQPTSDAPVTLPSQLPEVQTDVDVGSPKGITPTVPSTTSNPPPPSPQPPLVATASAFPQPEEMKATVHPTNYGERYTTNIQGQPVQNNWLIVLHETVGSGMSAIRHFQTPHPRDEDQASYHALIFLDGRIVYLVPPEKRAFGAGNSVFVGSNGVEAVQTNAELPASVNNFAYHIALETPTDGDHSGPTHSGYSEAQYQSLAWLIARTGVPTQRVTTHASVDRSGERSDPRSFDFTRFSNMLQRF